MKSDQIGKLAEALAKAQGEMSNAAKDKDNPFFKSKYADLTSIWEACREPLSKNGLAVSQVIDLNETGLILRSVLMHASGEWFESVMPIRPVKQDPQGVGSAITYCRRFALASLVGVAPGDDDDGNEASGNAKPKPHAPHVVPHHPTAVIPAAKAVAPVGKISREQAAELVDLCKRAGDSKEEMTEHLKTYKLDKVVDCDERIYGEMKQYFQTKIEFMAEAAQ